MLSWSKEPRIVLSLDLVGRRAAVNAAAAHCIIVTRAYAFNIYFTYKFVLRLNEDARCLGHRQPDDDDDRQRKITADIHNIVSFDSAEWTFNVHIHTMKT